MRFTASVEYVRIIMNYAPQFGLDPDKIYQKAGFDSSILTQPAARIPDDQFHSIWEALKEYNSDPDLGLHIGEKVSFFPGHILFMLMLNASTLKKALEKLCQYFNLLTDFTSPCLSVGESFAEIAIRLYTTEYETTRHANEAILSAYASVLHLISGMRIQFEGVYFVHPPA